MMPDPKTIAAYDIMDSGSLWRSGGRFNTKIFTLGPSTVRFHIEWRRFDSVRTQWIECHYEVTCAENGFELQPTPILVTEGKPVVDEFMVGVASQYLMESRDVAIEEALVGFGRIKIAEHFTRSMLENWRAAAVADVEPEVVEEFWQRYLEAETAIMWRWPDIDWAFLVTEDQAAEIRSSFGI